MMLITQKHGLKISVVLLSFVVCGTVMFGFLNFFKEKNGTMLLLVGLGNQGTQYEKNRHNVGFMAIDAIAHSLSIPPFKEKYFGQFAEHNAGGSKIGLLKTGQYMNEGGKSVAAVAKFYKIPPEKIIVFHDELDLKPGQVRAKLGGGNAGHNGLKSIEQSIGSKQYWRVRIGIGHPRDFTPDLSKEAAKGKVSSYVLSDFNKEEKKWLEPLMQNMGRASDHLIDGDADVETFAAKLR